MKRRPVYPFMAVIAILVGMIAGCRLNNITQVDGVVIGLRTWQQWQEETGWCGCDADDFHPSEEKIEVMSEGAKAKEASFLVFGGSWCPDTRMQFPLLFKVFDLASIGEDKIRLYGVDTAKREPSGTAAKFNIQKVPTVIVLVRGEEVGRITEYPEDTWEIDLGKIVSK